MRVSVVVATAGRAELTGLTVARLGRQTRIPDEIVVVGASSEDTHGIEAHGLPLRVDHARKGSCSQRNHALDLVEQTSDMIAIFDDDFVPAFDFIERAEALFAAHPEIVGVNGRLIADGAKGPGIGYDAACEMSEADRLRPDGDLAPLESLYGCNMVLRSSAIQGLRFDENLPLYGWQEDTDFTFRLKARGKLVKAPGLAGVHMGIKSGRTPGKKLGYSQIANPLYLLKKKTIPPKLAATLMVNNTLANFIKSFQPEPYIDRKGRLAGNMMALRDAALGKVDPRRVIDIG
ncbi:glycosyltransferase family 2 protein [Phenylobacterium koreense]|uniref:GT2 family glycosyltransferase n=1 Tax=Phenylobacterium koreense TaxID=266125 RepID=A0ABV2ENF7_9CAUL